MPEYEVEVMTTYYDVVRVEAADKAEARELALDVEPSSGYSETEIGEVYSPSAHIFFIGPESSVYHTDRDCPSLSISGRYWGLKEGWIQSDGSIKTRGSVRYLRRRACRRCTPSPVIDSIIEKLS